ncbi:MAG: carboxypeptidase regulatory-like domain-containing protein [Atribacterota bacterium]
MKGKTHKRISRVGIVLLAILFTLLSMGGCIFSPTPTGGISGIVTDNQSGEPLAGVLISAGNVSTTSDALGNYILNKVPVGNKEVTVVLEGYSSQTKTVEIIENEITELNFQLIPLSQENQRVVMVELYVYVGCGPCGVVEPILEQLAQDYGPSKMILLEEHLWDIYEVPEVNDRYDWYIPSGKGTPDALFDGLNQRRQGVYSYNEYKNIIDNELDKGANINISAVKETGSSTITLSGTIKNISSSALENLIIQGMAFEDRGEKGLRSLVLDIFDGQTVSSIAPDEIISFSFTSDELSWLNGSDVHGVIFVQAPESPTKEILQAAYVE